MRGEGKYRQTLESRLYYSQGLIWYKVSQSIIIEALGYPRILKRNEKD